MNDKTRPRLFIVDDEIRIRTNMKAALEEQDMGLGDIFVCACGEEALALASDTAPDIVITDVVMPGMSGHELIEHMNGVNPACIYIMISGYSEISYLQKAIQLRVIGYVLKPIDYDELLLSLHAALDEFQNRPIRQSDAPRAGQSILEAQESSDIRHRAILELAANFVEENYRANIGATDIARHCGISTGYLSTIFRRHAKMAIPTYINNIRLNQAEEMLADVRIPITQIAEACGFNNLNYFTRVFGRHYGMNPSAYREERLSRDL